MKTLWKSLLIIPLIYSCASSTEEKKEAFYDAVEAGNLTQLKEIVGNDDLDGQSGIHNYLAMNSCNRTTKKTNEDVAQYLIDKGAKPVEKSANHPTLENFPLRGPLAQTMDGPDCEKLLRFYLDHMSSEDVANAALNYKAITTNDLYSMSVPADQKQYWISWYLQNSPGIYGNHFMVYKKNEEFCKQGKETNCKAAQNMKAENINYHRTIQEVAFYEACEAYDNMKSEENLMKQQLEFGKQTGVASPKTYDAHARQAQEEKSDIAFYTEVLKFEIGKKFDPSYCPGH